MRGVFDPASWRETTVDEILERLRDGRLFVVSTPRRWGSSAVTRQVGVVLLAAGWTPERHEGYTIWRAPE